MNEYLITTMWFLLSNKIKRNVEETKEIMQGMYKRLESDNHFNLSEFSYDIQDAFEFYLKSKKTLNFD